MVVCPHCGEHNPDRARFCLNCGQPLALVLHEGEERKIVTVLFCDLVGFTARSDRADPEDVKATLRPYHTRLKQEIEHYGGTLDKFIGDGVLGVFGAPAVHEDDPVRAVTAALRIQEAMSALNEANPGLELFARAGIATGEAVVAFGEGPQIGERITGDVVNTASRIQAVAPPGGVVVAEATYQATRDTFEYESLGEFTVKGKAEPLLLWRAIGLTSRLGVGVDLHERHGTPFVGRGDELFTLKATYRRALRESSVQLVTVTGEPGVGKSRLLAELRSYIDELPEIVRWRQGRCLPYGEGITFWALSEIVKAQAGILESDPPKETQEKLGAALEAAVEDEQEREWIRGRLAPLAGVGEGDAVGPGGDRTEAFTAWRRFLEALAVQYPMVLVFEDLQWGDEPMLAFIEHLVDWSIGLPLLVVCVARPELYERHPDWGGGKRNSTTIPLGPLSERETTMLLSALFDSSLLPAETVADIHQRAGGNPLYAEEFARLIAERGLLERPGEGPADERAIPVPENVYALVAARLDTLPPERKALLHDAAIIGHVFWDGALAEMSGMDRERVRQELHEMSKKELVRPARSSSVEDQYEYSFWHLLIRDVASGQIPRSVRGEKHRAAAVWIERVTGDRAADRADVLAYHYEQALELAVASGGDSAELREAASRYLGLAGDRNLKLDARQADAYYRRAIAVLPVGNLRRARLLVSLAKAAAMAGRFDQARQDAQAAVDAFRKAGDRQGEGSALATLAITLQTLGDTVRGREILDQARDMLESEPPGPELVRVYNRIAGNSLVSGGYEESLGWSEKALALAEELGLEDEAIRARQFRGAARCDLGDAGGLEDLWEALREALDLGLGEETALCYGNLAFQLWLKEGPEISEQVWRSALEFNELRGFGAQALWAKAGLLEVLFDLGRWDEVLEVAGQMLDWDRTTGASEAGTYARTFRTLVLAWRGRLDEAATEVEVVLREARAIQNAEFAAPAFAAAMLVADLRDDAEQALALAEDLAAVTEGLPGFRATILPAVSRLLVRRGRADRAAELILDESAAASARYANSIASAVAAVAEGEGRTGQALLLDENAASRWKKYGHRLERALALLGRARCLIALGRDAEASADADAIREAADELGATALLRALEGLPSAVGS